jgi:hypothetical protein
MEPSMESEKTDPNTTQTPISCPTPDGAMIASFCPALCCYSVLHSPLWKIPHLLHLPVGRLHLHFLARIIVCVCFVFFASTVWALAVGKVGRRTDLDAVSIRQIPLRLLG